MGSRSSCIVLGLVVAACGSSSADNDEVVCHLGLRHLPPAKGERMEMIRAQVEVARAAEASVPLDWRVMVDWPDAVGRGAP